MLLRLSIFFICLINSMGAAGCSITTLMWEVQRSGHFIMLMDPPGGILCESGLVVQQKGPTTLRGCKNSFIPRTTHHLPSFYNLI